MHRYVANVPTSLALDHVGGFQGPLEWSNTRRGLLVHGHLLLAGMQPHLRFGGAQKSGHSKA